MRIKLLLLSLLTPLLCGLSFATNNFDNFQDYIIATGSFSNIGSNVYTGLYVFDTSVDRSVCMAFSGLTSGKYVQWGFQNKVSSPNVVVRATVDFPKNYLGLGCSWGNKNIIVGYTTATTPVDYILYDFGAFLSATNNGGGSSDCSSVESQLSSCQSSYSGLLENYNSVYASNTTCQSDLATCTNSCDTLVNQCISEKNSLSGSLTSCQETNSSLQNYNDSLDSQLQECLSSSGSYGSGANLIQFDIFWKDGNIDYSLPITNNLFLPTGYKGKLNDDRVLTITKNNSLEYAYSIDDDSFQTGVVDMFGKVFVFLMSSGLFLIFLYAIRRYFIGLKAFK